MSNYDELPEVFREYEYEATMAEADREQSLKAMCIRGILHAVKADFITAEHGEQMIKNWFGDHPEADSGNEA